jgi:hypothetical protein
VTSIRKTLHVITNSEVESWRTCHARWGFAYSELLRPVVRPRPLSFGGLYHAGAAEGWRAAWQEREASNETRALAACAAAFRAVAGAAEQNLQELGALPVNEREEAQGEVEAQRDVAQWAVLHYFEVRQADLRLLPLAIETPFDVPIPNNAGQPGYLRHAGVLDLVLWDSEQGAVIVVDHKTSTYGADVLGRKLPLDTQMSGYLRAVRWMLPQWDHFLMGGSVRTTPAAAALALEQIAAIRCAATGLLVFNVVRRAKPHEPKVNLLKLPAKAQKLDTELGRLWREQEADGIPRGEVSAAACDTTAKVYRNALLAQQIERHQAVTPKQHERLEQLERKGESYVEQLEFYRGEDELERWRQEMWVEARGMRAAERDPVLRTRNPSACSAPGSPRCVYAQVCLAPDSPEARAEFRVAASRHEEVSEAQNERHGASGEHDHGEAAGAGAPEDDPF